MLPMETGMLLMDKYMLQMEKGMLLIDKYMLPFGNYILLVIDGEIVFFDIVY